MSSLTAKVEYTPTMERARTERSAIRLFQPAGSTLEDSILGVWEDLVADGRAECPVCASTMSAAGGCRNCGADLS
jgi:hypothetical protein